jgi:hydroxypyruvate reductase
MRLFADAGDIDLHAYSSAAATVIENIAKNIEMVGEPVKPPVALLTGGHLDVPVGSATGVGGRNQEFALVMAQLLGEGNKISRNIVVAAMDSDGTDGPGTQHQDGAKDPLCMAGGIVDGSTLEKCRQAGIDVAAELANHNSTAALMATQSAIYTGNTGMCLGDLRVVIVRQGEAVF